MKEFLYWLGKDPSHFAYIFLLSVLVVMPTLLMVGYFFLRLCGK